MKKWLDKYESKGEVINPNNPIKLKEVVIKANRPTIKLQNLISASNTPENVYAKRFPYETEQTKNIRLLAQDQFGKAGGDLISAIHPIGAVINALYQGADQTLPFEGLRFLPDKIPFKNAKTYNNLIPILKPASKGIDLIQMFDKLHTADSLYNSADSIDLYNQFKNGGLVSKNSLNRKVTCSNCGWSWKLSDGGEDPLTCHKCGGTIKMKNGGELDEYKEKGEVKSNKGSLPGFKVNSTYKPYEEYKRGEAYVKKQNDRAMEFHKKWMSSPRYKQMLYNSDPVNAKNIEKTRWDNYNKAKLSYTPIQPHDHPDWGAATYSNDGHIEFFPTGLNSNVSNAGTHEVSHLIDLDKNKNFTLPTKDVNKINLYSRVKTPIEYFFPNLFPSLQNNNLQPLSNALTKEPYTTIGQDFSKDFKFYKYVAKPTETRARLNDIRQKAYENNLYDPFTQKVNKKIFNKLLHFKFENREGFNPLGQLKGVYSDDEIIDLLNTVSKNNTAPINTVDVNANGLLMKHGGVIEDNMGQWAHPGQVTRINSNEITMQGVPYPVTGVDNLGNTIVMQPGMNYTFPGQYVTEYPMMQYGGLTKYKEKGEVKKTKSASVVKKPVYEYKPQNLVPPSFNNLGQTTYSETTPIDVKKAIEDHKDKVIKGEAFVKKEHAKAVEFHKKWMSSPMYKQMLYNSDPVNAETIEKNRWVNFNNINSYFNPIQPHAHPRWGAASYSNDGHIEFYPRAVQDDVSGTGSHEFSHSTDRPKGLWNLLINNRNIPNTDENKMYSYSNAFKNNPSSINKLAEWRIKNDPKFFNYVAEPTETRARLNVIRQKAYENKIYDPFTQKVDNKIFNKLFNSESFKKDKNWSPLWQLQNVYTNDQIIDLLNTVSFKNNKVSLNPQMIDNNSDWEIIG